MSEEKKTDINVEEEIAEEAAAENSEAAEADETVAEEGVSDKAPETGNSEAAKAGETEAQGAGGSDETEADDGAHGAGGSDETGADDDAQGAGEGDAENNDSDAGAKDEAAESERYMRLMAEFQNYKKRVAKEKSDIHAYANENIMSGLLEVLDNFERALEADPGADPEGYAKGMELILTKMQDVLGNAGLKAIEALGADFDPAYHNAVMTEDTDEYESGKVSKVMQKGYTLNGKVIRPAMVAVAN